MAAQCDSADKNIMYSLQGHDLLYHRLTVVYSNNGIAQKKKPLSNDSYHHVLFSP